MINRILPLFALALLVTACGQSANNGDGDTQASGDKAAKKSLDNEAQKRSYALGMDIGNSLKELPVELKLDYLSQGLRDTIAGGETLLTQQELQNVMQGFVKELENAQQAEASADAEENLKQGQQFLAKNKDKEGVKVTDSGLQYKVVEAGSGPSPGADDSVKVDYEGTLIDGTVFDSSYERGEAVTFPVNAVIPGWTEALQMMKEGAKYQLFIPPNLAYGERGAGAKIGPNETLIFTVELLKVLPQEKEESGNKDEAG